MNLWDSIDPEAPLSLGDRSSTGFDQGDSSNGQNLGSTSRPFWSPQHPSFGFGLALLATGGLIYVALDEGASVKEEAHLGPAHAEAGAGV
jgi:hypothetical protein